MQVVKLSKDVSGLGAKGDVIIAIRKVRVEIGDWIVKKRHGGAICQRWAGEAGEQHCVVRLLRSARSSQ